MYRAGIHSMDTSVAAYRKALHLNGHKSLELEFRVGRRGFGGAFQPGVHKHSFDALMTVLKKSSHFHHTRVCTHERLNMTDARFVTFPGQDGHEGHWTYKQKLFSEMCSETIRVSLALEGTAHEPPPPGSPPFTYFRTKTRDRFRWECWSIDLTAVTSNLPQHADNDGPIYELEIELVDVDALYEYTLEYILTWGLHLTREIESLCNTH